jgi:hypothetical protein
VRVEHLAHGELTIAADLDETLMLADEEVPPIRANLLLDERMLRVVVPSQEGESSAHLGQPDLTDATDRVENVRLDEIDERKITSFGRSAFFAFARPALLKILLTRPALE